MHQIYQILIIFDIFLAIIDYNFVSVNKYELKKNTAWIAHQVTICMPISFLTRFDINCYTY